MISDTYKFRKSLQNDKHIMELVMRYLPEETKLDLKIMSALNKIEHDVDGENANAVDDVDILRNLNPEHLVQISKAMNVQIQRLQQQMECLSSCHRLIESEMDCNVTDISLVLDVMTSRDADNLETKTTESMMTDYTPAHSGTGTESREMMNSSMKQFTLQSAASFRVYRNDSGTEISFDPISYRGDDQNTEIIDDHDVRVNINEDPQKSALSTLMSCDSGHRVFQIDRECQTSDWSTVLDASPVVETVETGCSIANLVTFSLCGLFEFALSDGVWCSVLPYSPGETQKEI